MDLDWQELERLLKERAVLDGDDEEEDEEEYTLDDYLEDHSDTPPVSGGKETVVNNTIELGKKEEKLKEKSFDGYITDEDCVENSSLLYPEEKVYRSMVLEHFTPENLIELEKITRTFSISNNKKIEEVKKLLDEWGVPHSPLGGGTNRYGFMSDGFVAKIALDKDGKIDNKREFKYSQVLYPSVIKCYETSEDGLIAFFEYVEIFTIDDFFKNQMTMREMLKKIAEDFLIGDVGISSTNYVNWGWRNDKPVILDFAYIYSVAFKKFTCRCSPDAILHYDKDFNYLVCPLCGKKYDFKSIRKRISRKEQDAEIGDLAKQGYVIYHQEEVKKFDPRFVYGAMDAIYRHLLKLNKKSHKHHKEKRNDEDEPLLTLEEILAKIEAGDYNNQDEED